MKWCFGKRHCTKALIGSVVLAMQTAKHMLQDSCAGVKCVDLGGSSREVPHALCITIWPCISTLFKISITLTTCAAYCTMYVSPDPSGTLDLILCVSLRPGDCICMTCLWTALQYVCRADAESRLYVAQLKDFLC